MKFRNTPVCLIVPSSSKTYVLAAPPKRDSRKHRKARAEPSQGSKAPQQSLHAGRQQRQTKGQLPGQISAPLGRPKLTRELRVHAVPTSQVNDPTESHYATLAHASIRSLAQHDVGIHLRVPLPTYVPFSDGKSTIRLWLLHPRASRGLFHSSTLLVA